MRPVAETSQRHHGEHLVELNGGLILDPEHLGEPSSIAHSAFLLVALLRPRLDAPGCRSGRGILR